METPFIIDRSIFDNGIWRNIAELRMFLLILAKARFKEESITIEGIEIGRGQWLRSYRKLQEDLEYIENKSLKQYSLSNIKRIAMKLERDGRVALQRTEYGTVFTVCNYNKYQDLSNYKNSNRERNREQLENSLRTVREQLENKTIKDIKEIKEINVKKKTSLCEIENFPREVVDLANYFSSTLPKNLIPKNDTAKIKWLDVLDKCHRLDGYEYKQIREVIEHFRNDSFWVSNFMTPVKLRRLNNEGVKYIDYFWNRLSAIPENSMTDEERKRIKRNEEIIRKAKEGL